MSLILPKDCRIEVQNFAVGMETNLRNNDGKGGWKTCPTEFLAAKLLEETAELLRSTQWGRDISDERLIVMFKLQLIRLREGKNPLSSPYSESYDVGNIAMMLGDPERVVWEDNEHFKSKHSRDTDWAIPGHDFKEGFPI